MSTIINRFVAINGNAKQNRAQTIVPLVARVADAIGTGVLVTATSRCMVGPSLDAVLGAFTRKGCFARAIGHGLRIMLADGSASPAFLERVGNVEGAVYVYAGNNKKDLFFKGLREGGVPCDIGVDCTWTPEGTKPGAKYAAKQPLTETQADALVALLMSPAFTSAGGGNGAQADARLGTLVDAEGLQAASVEPTPSQDDSNAEAMAHASEGETEAPKGAKGGKRKVRREAAAE